MHRILQEEDFKSPWSAIENAVDQCIEVYGFDECSRMLDGFSIPSSLPASIPGVPCSKGVTFDLQIELLYGSENTTFSKAILPHDLLHEWSDKPWAMRASSHHPSVEPLSDLAVSSPEDGTGELAVHRSGPQQHPADGQAGHPHDSALSSSVPTLPAPTDNAIYDMDRSWLMALQCDWREHATVEHQEEGRVLTVRTWYLHHADATRCGNPRLLKLDRMDHLWLADLRELWADVLRAGEVLHLTYVAPQPPRADDQPFAPHIILMQGIRPDRTGIVITARFLEDQRTQLMQLATSSPLWMCGNRAVDLMGVRHLVQHRRWIARVGSMMFDPDELEEIAEGLSICIDVRVPPPDTDQMSLASWTTTSPVPAVPVMAMEEAVQQDDDIAEDSSDSESASSSMALPMNAARAVVPDWRFAHVYRTQRRVYHGYLPWNDATSFHRKVANMALIEEEDIVRCHHVATPPADLQAANTEALILQSVADLPVGSVHRLILVDVEFHEHVPAHEHSTSRRCLSLPSQIHGRVLLRLLGLQPYCERVRDRCLVWLNHEPIPLQRSGLFTLHHGDYLRVAVPPLPHAAPAISTRVCVSRARHGATYQNQLATPRSPHHEDGMTDVDEHVRRMYRHERNEQDEDDGSFLQFAIFRDALSSLSVPSHMLTSEVATLCLSFASDADVNVPSDKLDDGPPQRLQEARDQAARHDPLAHRLAMQPPFVQDLHRHLVFAHEAHPHLAHERPHVEVWYSDHLRRPHSGTGRLVSLSPDFSDWMTEIIAAWEDLIDPFRTLTCHIAQPRPVGGDPEALVHIVLVQNAQPEQFSVLVDVTDEGADPWHPRLMCLTVPAQSLHAQLQVLIDLDHRCPHQTSPWPCRSWFGQVEITDLLHVALFHGATLAFLFAPAPDAVPSDSHGSDIASFLQLRAGVFAKHKHHIKLDTLVSPPPSAVWVDIDCHKLIFLRRQLHDWSLLHPVLDVTDVQWHPATRAALTDMLLWRGENPLKFTFYTDGSATRRSPSAHAAVVLIVTTEAGCRWGGYVTTDCSCTPTAPRAETMGLLLASRWCRQLLVQQAWHEVPVEFAFDCQHVAGIAQGQMGGNCNEDLAIPLKALLHWIEAHCSTTFQWTHLRGHRGHPWNEAADVLCRHARLYGPSVRDMMPYVLQCTFDKTDFCTITWLWLLEHSLQGRDDAPYLQNFHWRLNIAQPLSHQPDVALQPVVWRKDIQPGGPRDVMHFRLQLGTANVLTLFPGQDHSSGYFSARAEGLAHQFLASGVHFVGLQETRSRCEGHTKLHDFHVLSAPATARGVGGVQLWIRTRLESGAVKISVDASHLHILHASSHRLVVRFQCDGLRLLLLVLHAPPSEDETVLTKFWQATSMAIPSRYRSWPLFVLADANARLGSVPSAAVGDHHAAEENLKGEYFHRWLLENNLAVPQTWATCHYGPSDTWTHATGAKARLDYIACHHDLLPDRVSTWIDDSIDVAIHREDHVCVRAQIDIEFYSSPRPAHHQPRPGVLDLPRPTWATDVHTHAAVLQHQLRAHQTKSVFVRKKHLTADTLKLIQAKSYHRKRLMTVRRHHRLGLLRQLFSSWKSGQACDTSFAPWLRECDHLDAWHSHAYIDLAPRVVLAVRQDDKDFYEGLAVSAGQASLSGACRLWQALKPILPRWKAKQRSNLRCVGPSVSEKLDHYNELEAGQSISYMMLLQNCHQAQLQAMHEAPVQLQLHDLPSRVQIEKLLAGLKPQKAPGIDEVLPSSLKQAAPMISADLTKLFVKMWSTGAEPLQFKGGLLHTIGKKKRSAEIKNMRGIALLDCVAKVSHAVLRSQFVPSLQAARTPLQLGGFQRQSTLFATQYLRAFEHCVTQKQLSSCVIFLDIKSAFHALVRAMVFDAAQPLPQRLCEVLAGEGCDLTTIAQRCDHTLFSSMPNATARLLSDAHDHTWYTVAASDAVQQTTRGSRPGSPLADVAYNALMTRIVSELQDTISTNSQLRDACEIAGCPFPIVAWVDDLAIPVLTQHAEDLSGTAAWVLQEAVRICKTYGLTLNLQPSKTEAVIAFRGPHAPACRQACYDECQGSLPCADADLRLRCVPCYEHLGAYFTAGGGIGAELRHRGARALQAHHQIRKPILHNRHLTCHARLRLLDALIMPILLHGAGNWPLLNQPQLTKLHGQYLKWVRSIVNNGCWTHGMLTDQALLQHWRLPTIPLRLAKMRLLYAFHWVCDCPTQIIDVVLATQAHSNSWFPALRHALRWLRTMDSTLIDWDPQAAPSHIIVAWLQQHSIDGPRIVRRLYLRAIHQGHLIGRVVQAHHRLRQCFELPSGPSLLAPISHPRAAADFECRWCGKTFGSLTALSTHQWLAHEVVSEERQMMDSTICGACHKCFWSSQRLQQHLRHSRRQAGGCYEQLTWHRAPHHQAPDIAEDRNGPRYHRRPAVAVPMVPTALASRISSRDAALAWFWQCWQDEGVPREPAPEVFASLQHEFSRILLNWGHATLTDVDSILFQLLSAAEGSDLPHPHGVQGEWAFCDWILGSLWFSRYPLSADVFQRLDAELRDFVHASALGRLLCWKRRMDGAFRPLIDDDEHSAASQARELETIIDPCLFQHKLLSPLFETPVICPESVGVPLGWHDGQPIIWILHLFSGRRRRGDCHWWLSQLAAKILPEYQVRLISVDTAIDGIKGDLSLGRNLDMIIRMAKRGLFSASLTGPPCETFSAARGLQMGDEAGPRPLRTASLPWCLHDRSARELRQCDTGTELLLNSLRGGALMEHPEEPPGDEKVSVWRLACHREWCMALRDACRHRIEQWLFGAIGIKPTCLRALNLGPPGIIGRVLTEGAEMWRTRPRQGLKGRQANGQWRTASAKEYPSTLCRSLVVAVLQSLKYRMAREGVRTPVAPCTEELMWIRHMSQAAEVLTRESYPPDYQRDLTWAELSTAMQRFWAQVSHGDGTESVEASSTSLERATS
eukprot:s3346_g7.t1